MKTIYILFIVILIPFEPIIAAGLTEKEKQGIQLMREEEKLAHDVYQFLYEKWELPIFSNISSSETRHFDAIGFLIETFELEDLAKEKSGEFENKELQILYDSLTQRGSESLIAALKVGAFIEEVDIADLQRLINASKNETINNVYQNLLRASGNHIRAFTGQLSGRNIEYSPLVLELDVFKTILDTPHQRGGGNANCIIQQDFEQKKASQGRRMRRRRGRN